MQEYRSGLPFLSPGDLPDPGNKPGSPALQADSLPSEPPRKSYRDWSLRGWIKDRGTGGVRARMESQRDKCECVSHSVVSDSLRPH